LPDLSQVSFFNGAIDGHKLLLVGILFCLFGLGFGMAIFMRLKNLPVHRSMREISELIYETCKTYLVTQGKFILLLWAFIAVIIAAYFGWLSPVPGKSVGLTLPIILGFSLVGIAGSYGVAWFGIRVNTFANSRTAFASLPGKPYPVYQIPLEAGMSIGMMLISVELLIMLFILLFIPGDYAGPCFIGFAIGESLGAAALRIAGGIFTKIADIGSDLMKIVFKIKEDDARNPGVIADCTGDNAGDSVGPSADGFETYGVTGVALITFILLGVKDPSVQVQLLVWIFVMRVMMLVSSAVSYFLNGAIAKAKYGSANEMNFEAPLTTLVWLTSIVSIALTYLISYFIIPTLGTDTTQWWKLGTIISCGTGEGIHLHRIAARERSGGVGAGRRSVAGHSVGIRGRKFLRLLSWAGDDDAHGDCVLHEHDGTGGGCGHASSGGVRVWAGGVRISGHGSGDDCGGLLRSSNRQRTVGVRTLADRGRTKRAVGDQEGLQPQRGLRACQAFARSQRWSGQHV
jgi:K(+)-stimulated pyrophosphate-energized sodium pump